MKKTMNNSAHVEGFVYEHKLEKRTSGNNSKNPGTEFIAGTLSVATDEDLTNIVQIHFTYVTPIFAKSGKVNNTYNTLAAIIDEKIPNVMDHGKENAGRVRIDSALALNEWYDSRTQGNPLVSVKRNEGGFVHLLSAAEQLKEDVNDRATFDVDMVITKVTRIEADEEKGTQEKMTLGGYIFDFRNSVLPVEFSVVKPAAMNYFESFDISGKNPFFTHLRGCQVSQTVEKKTIEESAFGDASISIKKTTTRDFVVNWAPPEPYLWDDESTILASELAEGLAAREIYLAEVKKRQDEYQATKGNTLAGGTTTPAAAPSKGDYNF